MKAYIVDKRDLDELERRLLDIEVSAADSTLPSITDSVRRRINYVFKTWKSEVLP